MLRAWCCSAMERAARPLCSVGCVRVESIESSGPPSPGPPLPTTASSAPLDVAASKAAGAGADARLLAACRGGDVQEGEALLAGGAEVDAAAAEADAEAPDDAQRILFVAPMLALTLFVSKWLCRRLEHDEEAQGDVGRRLDAQRVAVPSLDVVDKLNWHLGVHPLAVAPVLEPPPPARPQRLIASPRGARRAVARVARPAREALVRRRDVGLARVGGAARAL